MAMLAEPRRKQKWTLNPRGKHWSEDSNKFGQKMLEKMGWTSGKGLGTKEQGMTEHVRVKFKNDSAGIGYSKDDHDKEWIHHQEGFSDLLMNLQKSQNMEPTELMESKEIALSGMSLEQTSKQSKARVHYQKFTRGKDVNKYSAKDLANIFGKKTLEERPKIEEKVEEEFECEPIGSKDNTGGVVTIKGGNIQDYFKNKMSSTVKKNEGKEFKENSDSEEERFIGFGFNTAKSSQESKFSKSIEDSTNYVFENPGLDLKALPIVKPSPIPKPPRKRKNVLAFSNAGLDLNYLDKNDTPNKVKTGLEVREAPDCFVNPALNLECPVDETRNGAEFEVSRPCGLLNPALDLCEDTPKKKRKKEKNGTPKNIKTDFEVREALDCFVNSALNLECPVDETRNGTEFEVSRRCGLLNPALDLYEDTPKKKRKKEKNGTPKNIKIDFEFREAPDCFVNPALNLECPVHETRNGAEFEVSRPCGLLNPALDLCEDTPKKKRKKEKNGTPKNIKIDFQFREAPDCFVNPALNLECPVDETRNGAEFEVSRPCGLLNPALDLCEDTPKKKRKKEKNGTPKKIKTDVEIKEAPDCFVNSALNLECPVDETRNGAEFEVPRSCGLLNPALDLSEDSPKKKRKKEKHGTPKKIKTDFEVRETPDCFVNPALNLECPVDETRNGSEFEVSRTSVLLNPNVDLPEGTPKKKCKKRKKLEVPSIEGFVNSALNLNCQINDRDSGTAFEVSRVQMGLANDALNLSDEVSGKKRVTFNDLVEYNMDGVKKKKGKTKLDKFEVENEKLKRKKKHLASEENEMVFVNEALDFEVTSEEIQDNELNERKCRKEKRKKNRRMSNLETIEEAPEEEKEDSDEIIRELEVITVHEVSIEESEETLEAETPKKSKKKKKGEKSQEDLDMIEICESDKEDISLTEAAETDETKKKKKKKKEKKVSEVEDKVNGFDKENLFINQEEGLPEMEKKKKKRKSRETCVFFLDEDVVTKNEEPEIEEKAEEPRENKKSKKKRPRNSDVTIENEDSEAKKVENLDDCSTPSKKRRLAEEATSEVPQSPYEKISKKSKNVLKAMFAKSPVVHFKGSNINEIKGYGVER